MKFRSLNNASPEEPPPMSNIQGPAAFPNAAPSSTNPDITSVTLESESVVDLSDLIERNVLSAEFENAIKSTQKHEAKRSVRTVHIINDRSELEQIIEDLRRKSLNTVQLPRLHFPRSNLVESDIMNAFNSTIIAEMAPSSFKFEEIGEHVILHYPMQFVVANDSGRYLDEDDSHLIPDGAGYPAMFPRTAHVMRNLEIRGRPSLTTYQSNVSPSVLSKITGMYDLATSRAFQNCFQLRSEDDALWIIRNRAGTARVGDNHLVLFVRAFMYYFDSLHVDENTTTSRRLGQRISGCAYNIQKETGWITSVAESSQEIINCIGMPHDYAQFWAFCCLPSNECYVTFGPADHLKSSPFSMFRSRVKTNMCVVSDCTVKSGNTTIPAWFRNPEMILSFIEMYCRRFGLQQQVNDACAIAQLFPIIQSLNLPFTLPEPLHACDWFDGQINPVDADLTTTYLMSCNRTCLLAALYSAPMVLAATLYDLQSTLLMNRPQFAVTAADKRIADSLLGRLISEPGLVPRFLLQTCLGLTGNLTNLIGWDRTFVPIQALLPTEYTTCRYPLHLLLLQRLSGRGSVRANLPLHVSETWKIEILNATLHSAFNTFMAIKRVGLMSPRKHTTEVDALCHGIVPLMAGQHKCSVTLDPWLAARIRYLIDSKVTIQFCQTYRPEPSLPWTIAQPEIHLLLNSWEESLNPLKWNQATDSKLEGEDEDLEEEQEQEQEQE